MTTTSRQCYSWPRQFLAVAQEEGPQKCLVYLKLSRRGNTSFKFQKQIKIAESNCYRASKLWFSTKSIPPGIHHNDVPSLQQSNVVYEYVCLFNAGPWPCTPRLQHKFDLHAPKSIKLGMEREGQVLVQKLHDHSLHG